MAIRSRSVQFSYSCSIVLVMCSSMTCGILGTYSLIWKKVLQSGVQKVVGTVRSQFSLGIKSVSIFGISMQQIIYLFKSLRPKNVPFYCAAKSISCFFEYSGMSSIFIPEFVGSFADVFGNIRRPIFATGSFLFVGRLSISTGH